MDVTPLISSDQQVIQAYAEGRFKVSNHIYETPIFVYPDQVQVWNAATEPHAFTEDDFQNMISQLTDVDICLLGAGKSGFFVPDPMRALFREKRIALDVMVTGAACRTYNVLLAEERRVVAALYPV